MDTVKMDFNGQELIIETGQVARQANGSVLVKLGGTVVLGAACGKTEPKEGIDFFPLTVEYQEKFYSAGKIPGSFFKREARAVNAMLTSRLIDRPIRPLFPEGYKNEVQVIVIVLSYDGKNETEALGMIAASAALSLSDIPFQGPIGSVVVGKVDGKYGVNFSPEQMEQSVLSLSVAGTKEAIMMVEAGAKEVSEKEILEALDFGHQEIKKIVELQEKLVKKAGKEKMKVIIPALAEDLNKKIEKLLSPAMKDALKIEGKQAQYNAIDEACESVTEAIKKELGEDQFAEQKAIVEQKVQSVKKEAVRRQILIDKKRADGRKFTDIRPLNVEVGLLPCAHGSGLFTRGETQALAVVTLGTKDDEQMIDGLQETWHKKFFLHYNFPPFSVGEVGRTGAPGRRELGHGALAERALKPLIPTHEKFPYTIRIVSEILESNGSSSMASVCGGSLALMDAGVPVKTAVAGIAMGLVKEGKDCQILTDIQGLEDHYGDMDFKVAGTEQGITALQMDIKIQGITAKIMEEALAQAKEARLQILKEMNKELSKHRDNLSDYAPQIRTLEIPKDKIGLLIGPGGKTIKSIIEETQVSIDIDDQGKVNIASPDKASIEKALAIVKNIVVDVEAGKIYQGKITRITNFGAFVELLPGREGLLHISKISEKRIDNVSDYLEEGQEVKVLCTEVDRQGRYNLTMRDIPQK